jgi:hypothetical protein
MRPSSSTGVPLRSPDGTEVRAHDLLPLPLERRDREARQGRAPWEGKDHGRHQRHEGRVRVFSPGHNGAEVPRLGRPPGHAAVGGGAGRAEAGAAAGVRNGRLRDPRQGGAAAGGANAAPGGGRLVDGAEACDPQVPHPGAVHRRRGDLPSGQRPRTGRGRIPASGGRESPDSATSGVAESGGSRPLLANQGEPPNPFRRTIR